MGSTRVRIGVGLGLLLVVGLLVIVLSGSEQRLAGSNAQVAASGNDVVIKGGAENCQPDGVPPDASQLRVYAGVPRGSAGPLDVVIKESDRTLATGSFSDVEDGLPSTTDLSPPVENEVSPAEVCFRNRGDATIRLAGDRTPIRFSGSNPYGLIFSDEPRVDYLRAGDESWWSIAGLVADRFGLAKTSFTGPWTMWAVFGLIAATWAAAIALLFRRRPVT